MSVPLRSTVPTGNSCRVGREGAGRKFHPENRGLPFRSDRSISSANSNVDSHSTPLRCRSRQPSASFGGGSRGGLLFDLQLAQAIVQAMAGDAEQLGRLQPAAVRGLQGAPNQVHLRLT
jgi:hypothetical protein